MEATEPTSSSDAGEAALALGRASAAAGVAAGQAGYQLTTKALQDSAAAVFPLLLLELTAIAGGFAAYAATEAAARVAETAAQAAAARGAAYWNSSL